jgi:hypothetical protein
MLSSTQATCSLPGLAEVGFAPCRHAQPYGSEASGKHLLGGRLLVPLWLTARCQGGALSPMAAQSSSL